MLILYCGQLWDGGTCRMRMEALKTMGCAVMAVDSTCPTRGVIGLASRAAIKFGHALDTAGANQKLLQLGRQQKPGIIWIDKGLTIARATLEHLRNLCPKARFVHYSLDDMSGRHNQSRDYLRGIPAYDLHVTNKSYNVAELHSMGARKVLFVNNAYCRTTHEPMAVSDEDRKSLGGPVGFIGAFETARAESLWFLAKSGIQVRIWGEAWGKGWKKWGISHRHPNLTIENRALFGADYAKAICSFDINLCFLRKLNRDQQTTRSVEIPACGGFMLAERTAEHKLLFAEDKEAVFFATHQELLAKCNHYLAHPLERQAIASASRNRCLQSDYSYEKQLKAVLASLES